MSTRAAVGLCAAFALVVTVAGLTCAAGPVTIDPEDVQFGFTAGQHLLCKVFDVPTLAEDESYLRLEAMDNAGESGFYPLPADRLPDPWRSRLGDTLLTVVYGKAVRMVINAFGWFETECWEGGPVYALAPIDSLASWPSFDEGFLILPFNVGSLPGIVSYHALDSVPPDMRDTLASRITGEFCAAFTSDLAERTSDGRRRPDAPVDTMCSPRTVILKCFTADDSSRADQLLVTLQYDMGSTEAMWFELLLVKRRPGEIRCQGALGPGPGDWRFVPDCSIDLDSDGFPEFFIINSHSCSLWRLANGQMTLVKSGDYRGC